jgi:hypothetical protein
LQGNGANTQRKSESKAACRSRHEETEPAESNMIARRRFLIAQSRDLIAPKLPVSSRLKFFFAQQQFFSSRNKTSVLAIIFAYDKRKMDLPWNDLSVFRAWFARSARFLLLIANESFLFRKGLFSCSQWWCFFPKKRINSE